MQFDEIIRELELDYKRRDKGLYIAPFYKLLWRLGVKAVPFPFTSIRQLLAIDGTVFFFIYMIVTCVYDASIAQLAAIDIYFSSILATSLFIAMLVIIQKWKRRQIGVDNWDNYVKYLSVKCDQNT
jgi:hypothetical protein